MENVRKSRGTRLVQLFFGIAVAVAFAFLVYRYLADDKSLTAPVRQSFPTIIKP